MQALIIAAHGSRRQTSNEELKQLGKQLADYLMAQPDCLYDSVEVSFLEFASPSIAEALTAQLNQGVMQIALLPYFLSAGNHVTKDIPAILDDIKAQWPQATITLLPHLGASKEAMVTMLAAMASHH